MRTWILISGLAVVGLLTGCQSLPPGAEPGPHGTMAYEVLIEASEPGARIEANGEYVGNTPLRLKIFGDPDGTFHDFGSDFYIVRALPIATNQFMQTRLFRTGHLMGPEDRIPSRIFFDMNQNNPPPYPYEYPPPGYYGPHVYVYPDPFFYGPGVEFRFGPRFHRRW